MIDFVKMIGILKKFGGRTAVDHLHLVVKQGEIYGLVGPNGAGKSTSIKMLCGLVEPDEGVVEIDGLSVMESPLAVKQRIGVVPQEIALFDSLTAAENIYFFGKLYGIPHRTLNQSVDEALQFVGLYERRKEKPKTFSGGMRRRLNIACSIVHQPKLLIMDEPTVGIDPQSRNHILESVKELNRRGTTIIYTSHYMEEVSNLCHRIGIMDHGRLVAEGTKDELREKTANEQKVKIQVKELTPSAIDHLRRYPNIKHVAVSGNTIEITLLSAQLEIHDIMFTLYRNHLEIQHIFIEEPGLEKMFLSLTGQELRD